MVLHYPVYNKKGDKLLVTVGEGQHVRNMGIDYIFVAEESIIAVMGE